MESLDAQPPSEVRHELPDTGAAHAPYLEVARVEALEAVGLSLPEMRRQGFLIVAIDLAVRYHSPARAGETLEILTHIREARGARSLISSLTILFGIACPPPRPAPGAP
jgi:hypothetical protein